MTDTAILTEVDKGAMIGLQIIIALFTAIFVVLSLIAAITIAVFSISYLLLRKTLILVLSNRQYMTYKFKLAGIGI